ncbi:MAG: hypothetical protein E7231_12965 [Cellulosilyticum sp.]|nr:hypothetical protein [Cellulosilyticum sp.]
MRIQDFELACQMVIGQSPQTNGIGTLKEKTVHAVLKNYYSPNVIYQEQRIEGFVADIFTDEQIIEIQTRNFNTMRKKLETFLPLYDVTIVYPIAATKWLSWINEETGEMTSKRKSPKRGHIYQIIPELYRIKSFLGHPNLHFMLTFLDIEEYRLLNGWNHTKKRGSTRHDGIPTKLVNEIYLHVPKDFTCFLPDTLPPIFTTKDFQKAAKITTSCATTGLHILYHIGVIERIGKQGRAYLYKRSY